MLIRQEDFSLNDFPESFIRVTEGISKKKCAHQLLHG
jgi:hypothetical protein